ncbi:MAG: hypothetical protein ABL962_09445 [Fimbriimonadaceae bacterium]
MECTSSLLGELRRIKERPHCHGNQFVFYRDWNRPGTPCQPCAHRAECVSQVSETETEIVALGKTDCFGHENTRQVFGDDACKRCDLDVRCRGAAFSHKQNEASLRVAAETRSTTATAKSHLDSGLSVTQPSTASSVSPAPAMRPSAAGVADKARPEYAFPNEDSEFLSALANHRSRSVPELMRLLETLAHGKTDLGKGSRHPYDRVRNQLCAISIALNERGWPAPRFRPMRKPTRGKWLVGDESVLSNDRQVIDLHWLRLNDAPAPHPTHRWLVESEPFDYSRASRFVKKRGYAKDKVRVLRLTESQQLLLGVLQDEATRDRWSTIEKAAERAENSLRSYVEIDSSRLNVNDIPDRVTAFKALAISRGNVGLASRIYRRVANKELSNALMRRRLKILSRAGVKLP